MVQTNIHNYGIAVMLSVNISAYKGDIPRNHVLVMSFHCLLFEAYNEFHLEYSKEVSFRFASRYRT